MGRSKALLPFGDSGISFVHQLVRAVCDGGVEEALVVARADDFSLAEELDRITARCRLVVNPTPDLGQLSSLLAGLAVADRPGVTGVLVTPVDVPFVSADAVRRVLEAFRATHAPVVRAVHEGRHGHPVVFSRAVFDELRRADHAHGAKTVLRAHAMDIIEVEVRDPIAEDVDTADDYERLFHLTLPAGPQQGLT